MITAKEARKIVDDRKEYTIERVLDMIKTRAAGGYTSIEVPGEYNQHADKLKSLGYSIGRGGAPNGGCSSTIRIMW